VSTHKATVPGAQLVKRGAWLSERLRRWSNEPDVVGSIPVTSEFFLISCDSNQVPKWFGAHYNLEVPLTSVKLCYSVGKLVFGVAPAIVQWAHYVACGQNASLTLNNSW